MTWIATLLLLIGGVALAALWMARTPYRAQYDAVVDEQLAALSVGEPITEADLAKLPDPAARYLRACGAIGRSAPTLFEAHWRGRIRSGEDKPWMTLDAWQANHTRAPTRHFWMRATVFGVPAQGLHAYLDGEASMDVRLLSLLPVARASGPEMTRGETVTLLNDMAVLVPSALLQSAVRWEPVDDRAFRVVYTVGSITVSGVCIIDEGGHLVDFMSDDRARLRDDGTLETLRWSTPVRDPAEHAGFTIPTRGEALWHHEDGSSFTYIELELLELLVDEEVGTRPR